MKHTLFVYGTLKRGFHNHVCLGDNATYLGEAVLQGYQMFHLGGFPAIAKGEGEVIGEVYEIDDASFKRCDRLEGYPSFYNRSQVEVIYDNDAGEEREMTAWVYHFDKAPKSRLIKDGIWRK